MPEHVPFMAKQPKARRKAGPLAPIVLGLALGAGVGAVQQVHPRTPHGHPEGEKLRNPVSRGAESLAKGRELYGKLCATCHGPYGLGNGRLATGMEAYGARPSNLTDREWQHGSTDGEIFLTIRDGVGPDFHMPAYTGTLSDDDIWNVVNYVRALGI